MDDLSAFERQVASEVVDMAGPEPRVDVVRIVRTAASAAPGRAINPLLGLSSAVFAMGLIAVFVTAIAIDLLPPGGEAGSAGATASPPSSVGPGDRMRVNVPGIPLSYTVPEYAWSSSPWPWTSTLDDLYIANDTVGPQGAEAMILFVGFPDSRVRPCLIDPSAGSSAADLAAAIATAPGTELVSGPSDVTVGGRAAKRVVLTVAPDPASLEVSGGETRNDLGCDPAYFFAWEPRDTGTFWLDTVPGDTIRIWIVEVGGKLLVIEAETKPQAGHTVERQIAQIIASISFE